MGEFLSQAFEKTLGEMLMRAGRPESALKEIGEVMVGEMKINFERGGRPNKWPESIRVQRHGGQTLRLSGHLMNSLSFKVEGVKVFAGPGSGVEKYARIHALGGIIKAKNKPFLRFLIPGFGWVQKKEVKIPARDYTYIPPTAEITFGEIMQHYVMGN